ncbi:hypothetical protein PSYJA_35427, partial [Pseudomonas syringae pv. japonica str. M301072]
NATNNIRWDSFEHFANSKQVKWAIPVSLGDSHRGYRVMGTNEAYFEHYQFGRQQHLEMAEGREFKTDPFEVVLGSEVAKALHYKLGDKLVLAHGVAAISLVKHDDKPFTVVGILKPGGRIVSLVGPLDTSFAKARRMNAFFAFVFGLMSRRITRLARKKSVSYSFLF